MTISDPQIEMLIDAAMSAREKAYAPYSRFAVGAALLTGNGSLFHGCNVENASFGAGVCAERTAGAAAIAAGQHDWQAMAIALSGGGTPCGICRQFISEFAPELTIVVADSDTSGASFRLYSMADLYPDSFSARDVRSE